MKTYEQRRREEFEKQFGRKLDLAVNDDDSYADTSTQIAWSIFCHAHKDFQTIADFVAMFPTKAAAARALNVDNKQLWRWEIGQAVLVGGVIYNRRKKDQ